MQGEDLFGTPPRGALYGQEIELLTFRGELDWDRDGLPGLPPDHTDLDLAVAG
jgi:hypothetical protein